jgi:hypothetical protein
MPQRGSLLPYRGVLSFLSKAREASGSEAARLHHPARRRGGCMAARGACAAIEGASHWIPGLRNPGNFYGSGCRIPGGAQGSRFCRRSKRSNRILVGAQSTRSAPVFGSRPCQTQRYGDRRDGRQYIGTGSQGGHDHYSSRLHDGR